QHYEFCIEKVADGCQMPCWAEKKALKAQECEACRPGQRGHITNLDVDGGCDPGPYMSIEEEEALTQEQQMMQQEPCEYVCR
ncbi:MAG: hypothetical protein VX589_18420, partial [Myxococcota bacterium]|nr:hypothetical protein [Myxococcota bacterium]